MCICYCAEQNKSGNIAHSTMVAYYCYTHFLISLCPYSVPSMQDRTALQGCLFLFCDAGRQTICTCSVGCVGGIKVKCLANLLSSCALKGSKCIGLALRQFVLCATLLFSSFRYYSESKSIFNLPHHWRDPRLLCISWPNS